jgi:hypothetical protein
MRSGKRLTRAWRMTTLHTSLCTRHWSRSVLSPADYNPVR